MKKYILAIFFLLISTGVVKAQAPWDLAYHALPVSITFDIPEEITQVAGNAQTAISQTKKIIMAIKSDISNIQSAVMSTFNKIKSGAILDIFGNPGQKKSGFCGKDVTKVSTRKIAKKMKELFFMAKKDDIEYRKKFNDNREKFYMDNVYVIYAASLIMQQQIATDIKAQIDKAVSCAKGNGAECGIPSTDEGGNNEVIFTYGKTLEAMDSVVRMWESVAALKARLAAVKMIKYVPFAVRESKGSSDSDEQAFLKIPQPIIKYQNITPISFAQLDMSKARKLETTANISNNIAVKTESLNSKSANLRAMQTKEQFAKGAIQSAKMSSDKLAAKVSTNDLVAKVSSDKLAAKVSTDKINKVELKADKLNQRAINTKELHDKNKIEAQKISKEATASVKNEKANLEEKKANIVEAVEKKEATLEFKRSLETEAKMQQVRAKGFEAAANKLDTSKLNVAKNDKVMSAKNSADKANLQADKLSLQATKNLAQKTSSIEAAKSANVTEMLDLVSGTVDFASPAMSQNEHPLASMQDEMDAVTEMNEVESMVAEAITTHNMILELPQYKEQAEQYLKAVQEYNDALERLKTSEKCAIRYLGKYFKNPHKVWSGGLPIEQATNHDLRKGISGWAFNAFELLKSGSVTGTFEAFKTAEENMNKKAEESKEDDAYLTDQNALNTKVANKMQTSNTQPEELVKESLTNDEVAEISEDPALYMDMGNLDEDGNPVKNEEGEIDTSGRRFGGDAADRMESESLSASKKGNATEETRKADMMSWQVGAEASKMLGDPTLNWGSASTGKKLIWNDTKRFYRIYLEKKYNNILNYVNSLSAMDIMEVVAKKMSGGDLGKDYKSNQSQRKEQIANLMSGKMDESLLNDEEKNKLSAFAKMSESMASKAQGLKDGFRSVINKKEKRCTDDPNNPEEYMACLEKELKDTEKLKSKECASSDGETLACLEVQEEILRIKTDIDNKKLLHAKDEVINIKASKEDKITENQLAAATAPVVFSDDPDLVSKTKISGIVRDAVSSNIRADSQKEIAESDDIKLKEQEIEKAKANLAAATANMVEMKLKIKNKKLALQEAAAPGEEAEGDNKSSLIEMQIAAITRAMEAKGENSSVFKIIKDAITESNNNNPVEGMVNVDIVVLGLFQNATSLVEQARQEASKIVIENGYKKMLALGDDLFSASSHGKIVEIHNEMIENLKNVTIAFTITDQAIKPLMDFGKIAVFADFLANIDTSEELEGFFVGSVAKERDFKAPYKLLGFDLPPVREVFHFDAIDFRQVKEAEEVNEDDDDDSKPDWLEKMMDMANEAMAKLSKQKRAIDKKFFLEYGGDIPLIWQTILSDYPFMESTYPLQEALGGDNDECERSTFSRGGIMPCLYGYNTKTKKYDYVLDITKNSKYIYRTAEGNENTTLGPCSSIKAMQNGMKIEPHHSFWKVFLNNGIASNKVDMNCEYSELGMLLEADKHNNLFLRKTAFNNFNRINKQNSSKKTKPIEKMGKVKRKNLAAAQHSELNRNQVGDFLKQAEGEKLRKDNLEDAKAGYEKSIETLYTMFKDYGFTPSESFNMANKDDYKLAEKTIKALKKQRLQAAEKSLQKIMDAESDRIKKAKEEIKEKKLKNAKAPQKSKILDEKNKKMKKLINFMYTDIDCLLKLSMTDADSNDLAIRLLKAAADKALLKKHRENNTNKANEYIDLEEAFCAIY